MGYSCRIKDGSKKPPDYTSSNKKEKWNKTTNVCQVDVHKETTTLALEEDLCLNPLSHRSAVCHPAMHGSVFRRHNWQIRL